MIVAAIAGMLAVQAKPPFSAAEEAVAPPSQTGIATPAVVTNQAAAPWLPAETSARGDADPAAVVADTPRVPVGLDVQAWLQHYRYDLDAGPASKGSVDTLRYVVDFRHDLALATRLTLHLSDRADFLIPVRDFAPIAPGSAAINSLREAYLSWRLGTIQLPFYIDAGRMNIRNGVGSGYNPTDFFKEGAVLTATTRDPSALRTDRLGVVAIRGQYLSEWGAATIAFIPALQPHTSLLDSAAQAHGFGYLGLDRTNAADALLVKVAPKISESLSLDLLALRQSGRTRLGANASALLGSALVGNLEAALVEARPLPGPGEAQRGVGWYARVAANVTWTLRQGLELTAEAIYAGDALDAGRLRAYRDSTDPAALARLESIETDRGLQQEPLARVDWFVRAAWRGAFKRNGLNIDGFVIGDAYDGSLLWQATVRQGFDGWSAGLLASGPAGGTRSEYGASPLKSYFGAFLSKTF